MARSSTTYLGYPMKVSDLFFDDNMKNYWNDSLDNPTESRDFDAMTTLLSLMCSRTPYLGYGMSSRDQNVHVRRNGKKIIWCAWLSDLISSLKNHGLLEDDVGLTVKFRFKLEDEL